VLTLLEPTGLRIECASNGKEVLELYQKSPETYDMIFMDVQMPEMDGYEATRRIRAFEAERRESAEAAGQTEGIPPIPIIAMTANVFREDIERCLSYGMNDHVGKPINLAEVMKKLHLYLP
jgi:CheY-like chemotaxis protein